MTSEKDSSPKYPSDISDEEWEIVENIFKKLEPYTTGRPRSSDLREILNAIFYLNKTGCPWRYLPNDFPSYKLVNYYYNKWTDNLLLDILNTALREHLREKKTENQIQQGRLSTVKVSREPQSLDRLLGSMAVS